jgi:hypothetical protein
MNGSDETAGSIPLEQLRVVSAEVTVGPGPLPHAVFEQSPRVLAVLEDGRQIELFSFYANERSFTADDFIGRTVEQGRRLKFSRGA